MKRLERKLLTAGTHLGEKGFTFVSEVAGGSLGAGIGLLIGALSSGITLSHGLDKGWKIGKDIGNKFGKAIGGTSGKILRKTRDISNLIHNPFDELSNAIIRFLVGLIGLGFFLDDIIAEKIIENKKQILVVLISIILTLISFSSTIIKSFYVSAGGVLGKDGVLEQSVFDLNISSSITPSISPFGGEGMENTEITAGYLDTEYYETFGKWHEALDLIPNGNYYKTNRAYLETGLVYIYATCDGVGSTSNDKAGAVVIEILCNDNLHKVIFVHESFSFIPYNCNYEVNIGQAIGIMGCTGKCYGAHVHYAVSIKNEKGNFETRDPIYYF